jgi:hypothetical protein
MKLHPDGPDLPWSEARKQLAIVSGITKFALWLKAMEAERFERMLRIEADDIAVNVGLPEDAVLRVLRLGGEPAAFLRDLGSRFCASSECDGYTGDPLHFVIKEAIGHGVRRADG